METPLNKSSGTDNIHWLDIAEIFALASSIGGSVACIWLQKFVYASIPLSASVGLNLLNRQRMIKAITEQNQSFIVTQLEQSNNDNVNLEEIKTKIEKQDQQNKFRCSAIAKELKKLKHLATVELTDRVKAEESQLSNIAEEIQEVRSCLSQLDTLNRDLDTNFSKLTRQQVKIDQVVKEMRVLGNNKQSIIPDENTANSYYEKGLVYQNNGYYDKAQASYRKALQLEQNCAEVYHNLGLLHLELRQNRQGVEELRKASQLYFEKRDLDNYHLTRDLIQKVHQHKNVDVGDLDESAVNQKVKVNELFSS